MIKIVIGFGGLIDQKLVDQLDLNRMTQDEISDFIAKNHEKGTTRVLEIVQRDGGEKLLESGRKENFIEKMYRPFDEEEDIVVAKGSGIVISENTIAVFKEGTQFPIFTIGFDGVENKVM